MHSSEENAIFHKRRRMRFSSHTALTNKSVILHTHTRNSYQSESLAFPFRAMQNFGILVSFFGTHCIIDS